MVQPSPVHVNICRQNVFICLDLFSFPSHTKQDNCHVAYIQLNSCGNVSAVPKQFIQCIKCNSCSLASCPLSFISSASRPSIHSRSNVYEITVLTLSNIRPVELSFGLLCYQCSLHFVFTAANIVFLVYILLQVWFMFCNSRVTALKHITTIIRQRS